MKKAPVIVGVDGSPSATRAATFAAELADRHALPLEVVHVFPWPAHYPGPSAMPTERAVAERLVAAAATDLGRRYPRLRVSSHVVEGHPGDALVRASRRAAYLVVGHRGGGGFSELLLGSVGVHTTTHARCPVVVVRGEPGEPGAPVLVGVDGSTAARAAARQAFDEARALGTDLVVALAWPPVRSWSDAVAAAGLPPHPDAVDPVEVSLGAIAERFPDVKVHRELRHGDSPPQVIATLAAERGAGLVVVGSRGVGGFRGLLMGGTCRALVDHSPCPVMVVPTGGPA